jgi:hypothetical protein
MSTEAQIKANRKNAQKSTGPKTDEGKAAVSQNAVKHGLFAESVIKGENEADYEAFHDQMLAELAPVGMVEFMLAERVVSLWWRLRRAERMQNQAIDDMIGRIVNSNQGKRDRECYYIRQGIYRGDPRMELDDLPLGRIAIDDWKYSRILDRMLMYERRMENSVVKLMKELKRFQKIRRIELENTEQKQSARAQTIPKCGTGFQPVDNMARMAMPQNPPAEKKVDLKKQSQFVPGLIGAKSFLKGDYDNNPAHGAIENKPKRSQFRNHAALKAERGILCSSNFQD